MVTAIMSVMAFEDKDLERGEQAKPDKAEIPDAEIAATKGTRKPRTYLTVTERWELS